MSLLADRRYSASDLVVRLGDWDVTSATEVYSYLTKDVGSVHVHPHFSPQSLHNDVAVLALRTPIDYFSK